MARYFLSPHRVARYYFHECDRYLRYVATPKGRKEEEGVPPYELDHSLVTKAILQSGFTWEEQVLGEHLAGRALVAPPAPGEPEGPLRDRAHTIPQTIRALRDATAGTVLYQPTIEPPLAFYRRYGLDPELVAFTPCRPDLVIFQEGSEGIEAVVVDLKATDHMKLSHRIQATLYSLILERVLEAEGLGRLRVASRGGVWLYGRDEPELFDLAQVRPPLETFLRHDLGTILRAPASEAFWHLYFRCEWCDFYRHCRGEAEAADDVNRFADVVSALQPSRYAFQYQANDYFDFELSNRLKSNAILSVWNGRRRDLVESIQTRLKFRVWAASSVIDGIREHLEGTGLLFAWPPKFELPRGIGFRHPLLSRLAFVTRYEVVLGYLDARARRTAAEPERLATANSLRLTYLGGDRYRLDAAHEDVDLAASDWDDWILTPDTDSGRRARTGYDDFAYRGKSWAPRNLDLALARVIAPPADGVVRLELKEGRSFRKLSEGDVCILEERFKESTSGKLIAELAALEQEDDPWLVRLVRDPVAACTQLGLPPGVAARATRLAETSDMTPSQLAAFRGIATRRLQLVWGPPGTGKTHFLGLAVLCLAEAHRQAGLPLRVLVTAFTHAAIDNCLRKLDELQRTIGVVRGGLAVHKMAAAGDAPVPRMHPKEIADFLGTTPIAVVGATVWQARKVSPEEIRYDVVVVDEASQLEVAESAIPIRRLKPNGRLVIAGDDRQLPPIVAGNYPVPEGESLLHRSILEALRDRDPKGETVATLLEMLEPPLQALDRDDVAAGIAFMQGLAQMCEGAAPAVMLRAGGSRVRVMAL